ncbi:unnamed protein product [Dovyalis caffra]|uniref:Uncharacterized protein n=1 Tax=Dovyalis caffra TaxID=77055 RepID=A0AAV1RGC7_9ROSI|nr:unnamed protein product [Dovyalis caffra]
MSSEKRRSVGGVVVVASTAWWEADSKGKREWARSGSGSDTGLVRWNGCGSVWVGRVVGRFWVVDPSRWEFVLEAVMFDELDL